MSSESLLSSRTLKHAREEPYARPEADDDPAGAEGSRHQLCPSGRASHVHSPVAEPVADVMLIPLIPFIPLIPLIPLISLDMVIEVLMDMPLIPEVIEEPLVATTAAAVGSLSHIIVTTSAADGFGVVSDCARTRGTSARKARDLEYILVVVFDSIVDYEIAYRS